MPTFTGTANPDILYGTISADTLTGLAADDLLYGFDGHDLVLGGEGDDLLYGGSGNDTLDGGAGTDIIFGQSGLDTVTYANSLSGITLNLADASASTGDAAGDMFFLIETFVLTGKNDTLLGVGHNLTFRGGDGHDLLDASAGANKLFGDGGNDTLVGGQWAEVLSGGVGFDTLFYGNAAQGLVLNALTPSANTGAAAGDTLSGFEAVVLTRFDDTVTLGGSLRQARGQGGNDSLVGGSGSDRLDGGDGQDTLLGGAGADAFIGGDGRDVVRFSTETFFGIDLVNAALGAGEGKGDTFDGIEEIVFDLGFSGTAAYVGGTADLTITLLTTSLSSLASLTCVAGAGAERFDAGSPIAGDLSVSYARAETGVVLPSGIGTDDLWGNQGAEGDVLVNPSVLILSRFDDQLTIGFAPYLREVSGGDGDDTISISGNPGTTVQGGSGDDTISGALTGSLIDGGSGADDISVTFGLAGSQGNLTVKGGSGDDNLTIGSNAAPGASLGGAMIEGGAGNDAIIDTTNAALSANQFVFGVAWGQDVIAGFDDAVDRIVFSGTTAAGLDDFADLLISGTNEETTLSFGLNSVTLIGLDVGNFTAADVIFQ